MSNFSSETMQIGGEGSEIFKVLREKTHQPSLLYPKVKEKYFLRQAKIEGFFFASRPALQEMLKEFLQKFKSV